MSFQAIARLCPKYRGSSTVLFSSIIILTSGLREDFQDWPVVHAGPISVGGKGGFDIKPQLKLGVDHDNVKFDLGIGDVRDGLRLAAKVEVRVFAETEGLTVADLQDNIECDTPGFSEALDIAQKAFEAGGEGLDKIADALHMDAAEIERTCAGEAADAEHPMKLRVKGGLGVGASAQVNLGWVDTKNFHMVGVSGKAAAAVQVGVAIFAGMHSSGTSMKIILGIGNFEFVYTMPVRRGGVNPAVP